MLTLIHPCVAIPGWAEGAGRRAALSEPGGFCLTRPGALTHSWDEHALTQALSAHPRIGKKAIGTQAEAALSRQEQGAVNRW